MFFAIRAGVVGVWEVVGPRGEGRWDREIYWLVDLSVCIPPRVVRAYRSASPSGRALIFEKCGRKHDILVQYVHEARPHLRYMVPVSQVAIESGNLLQPPTSQILSFGINSTERTYFTRISTRPRACFEAHHGPCAHLKIR